MQTFRITATALAVAVIGLSDAHAERAFIEWTSDSEGSIGSYVATVDATIVDGVLGPDDGTATDATFVADFAGSYSVLRYGTPEFAPAEITSTITFSEALPAGSLLLVIDVDYRGETVTVSSLGTALTLVEQRETFDGATSSFPIWDGGAGMLTENTPGVEGQNEFEASVFDVGGLTEVDVDFAGGLYESAIHLAIALPAAVPVEVTSWSEVKAAYRR